jgi:glycogen debranching enzyme
MRKRLAVSSRRAVLLPCAVLGLTAPVSAQSAPALAELRWAAAETPAGRFLVAPGERAMVAGYASPGLEVWTYPLQLLRGYRVAFRVDGDTTEIDGPSAVRSVEHTPAAATRVYAGPGFTVREHIVTPTDAPGATIRYVVESSRPVAITVHFVPSLNLMWPAGVGGQEVHWDAAHSAYLLDEPSRRFRGAIVSRQIVRHDEWRNTTRGADFARSFAFTLRATAGDSAVTVSFAGSSTPGEDPLAIAEALAARPEESEARARARYAGLHLLDVETPDSAVNRAFRWAQVTLAQAWVCNPQLGCGLVAGYGPSRGERRPQYAWFFAGDGLVAVDALLREGAYERARDELAFIMRYQNARTGAIWHEMSQSAGFLDWAGAYPYMFVHVDVTFAFLDGVRDYVHTTGDVAFANEHWNAIQAAYDYCRSTLPAGGALPNIPAGQQGMNEQDPQRDELTLSLAWVAAAESFAELARLTGHDDLAAGATRASALARDAIRPTYFDARRGVWASGHLRSGAPVEGVTGSLIALLHHRLLGASEERALLDTLASPSYRAPWGIRSAPRDAPGYDPDSYARGSVWAIGTAGAVMAFYEAGRAETATALWLDLVPWFALDAPGHMHEVLRGDAFAPERESVPDQTWSSAAFVSSFVRGTLGLELDGAKRELRFAPHLPSEWQRLRVRGIGLGGTEVGLTARTSSDLVELEIENPGPAVTLVFRPALARGARVRAVELSAGARRLLVGRRGSATDVANDVTVVCPPGRTTRLTLHLSARSA